MFVWGFIIGIIWFIFVFLGFFGLYGVVVIWKFFGIFGGLLNILIIDLIILLLGLKRDICFEFGSIVRFGVKLLSVFVSFVIVSYLGL